MAEDGLALLELSSLGYPWRVSLSLLQSVVFFLHLPVRGPGQRAKCVVFGSRLVRCGILRSGHTEGHGLSANLQPTAGVEGHVGCASCGSRKCPADRCSEFAPLQEEKLLSIVQDKERLPERKRASTHQMPY